MQAVRLQALHDEYEGRAHIFFVYIREAHARDGRRPIPIREGVDIYLAKDLPHRGRNATACRADLELDIPVLLDDMENSVDRAYRAWPDRLVVVDGEGAIAYPGARGPFGFDPDAADRCLERLLAR
jgi:hypothetical protein